MAKKPVLALGLSVAVVSCIVVVAMACLLTADATHADPVTVLKPCRTDVSGSVRRALAGGPELDRPVMTLGEHTEALPDDTTGAGLVFEFEVRHHDGTPATGATVIVGRGSQPYTFSAPPTNTLSKGSPDAGAPITAFRAFTVLGRGVTDGSGAAGLQLPPGENGANVDVVLAGIAEGAYRFAGISLGRRTPLQLPAGAMLEGQVLVDGAPPRAPLLLSIVRNVGGHGSNCHWTVDPLDQHLLIDIPGAGCNGLRNAQVIGTDGRFRFVCLSSTRSLGFRVADAYAPCEKSVIAPARDVTVRLHAASSVTARVVDVDGSTAVAEASIHAEFALEGEAVATTRFRCDAQGRCDISLSPRGWDRLMLEISHPDGRSYREWVVARSEVVPGGSLGSIALLSARGLSLRVRDAAGSPVAGAIVLSNDHRQLRSAPTDDAGRTELRGVAWDTLTATIRADGFVARDVPLSAVPPALLEITLDRCPILSVSLSVPKRTSMYGLLVIVRADRQLFASAGASDSEVPFGPDRIVRELRNQSVGLQVSSAWEAPAAGGGMAAFRLREDGSVRITDILPGVPFEVAVESSDCAFAWGPSALCLGAGETRRLDITLDATPVDMIVGVRTASGAVVRNAEISRGSRLMSWVHTSRTNQHGEATFSSLLGDTVQVRVSAEGFVTADLVLPVVGGPALVVLQRDGP